MDFLTPMPFTPIRSIHINARPVVYVKKPVKWMSKYFKPQTTGNVFVVATVYQHALTKLLPVDLNLKNKEISIMKNQLTLNLLLILLLLTACSPKTDSIEITKTPFPDIVGVDMQGLPVDNTLFSNYDATIVNFWNNGCGTCIAEMPDLESYYQDFKDKNINLIGVGADSGESLEQLAFAKKVLSEKGVTYLNISPDIDSDFYRTFINDLTGYPTTYIVDRQGNIIGNAIVGNVKNQESTLLHRLDLATSK